MIHCIIFVEQPVEIFCSTNLSESCIMATTERDLLYFLTRDP